MGRPRVDPPPVDPPSVDSLPVDSRSVDAWLVDARPFDLGRIAVVCLIGAAAGCSVPAAPPATGPVAVPPAASRSDASSPTEAPRLPLDGSGNGSGSGSDTAVDRVTAPPPAVTPATIETRNGITVAAVRRTPCPAGGGQAMARLLSSATEADERLAALGVAADTRAAILKSSIGWDRGERLLLVYGGQLPNPGHRLVVDTISRPAGEPLLVRGRVIPPAPGSFHAQVLVSPCLVIQLTDPSTATRRDVELVLTPGS